MDVAIDHYAILGLEYGATREEIKKAHRKLVLRCLPLPQLSTRNCPPRGRKEGGGPLAGGRGMPRAVCVASVALMVRNGSCCIIWYLQSGLLGCCRPRRHFALP